HVIERTGALPLREAIKVALPESTRAITAAGLTLAVSFGMLVVIPLTPFRELGFAMVVGILLDAVVVRSILMPCLLTLVGPISGWPGASFRYRVTDAVVASPGRKQPQRQ
ncbi:MAG TPA: MMPL family transporter, partial [Candidatus Nanopelagicales bacterium]|nr:MMPL family transporter [Candidatus Nanopelagicales bacterium]